MRARNSNITTMMEPYLATNWFSQAQIEVFSAVENFTNEQALTEAQAKLLATALQGLRNQLTQQPDESNWFVHLPLVVYGGLRGDSTPAIPLAVATSLLFLGLDIFDDLADGDQLAHWQAYHPSQINLAAATFLCSLPQLALSSLEAPPLILSKMQHTFAKALLVMSAGQQYDLEMNGKAFASSKEVEISVARKSGEEMALFSSLAAIFSGAPQEVVEAYEDFGRAIGTAGQLGSDCYDLFTAPYSRDLASGTRTLPIALRLEKLQGAAHSQFLDLLDRARTNPEAQAEVRKSLRQGGEFRYTAFRIEVYCQITLKKLDQVKPLEPFASYLKSIIKDISLFSKIK